MPLRRGPAFVEDFAESPAEERGAEDAGRRRRPGVRVNFTGGLVPSSVWGRIAAAGGLVVLVGGLAGSAWAVRSFVLHDPHFVVDGSSAVEIAGNSHLSRAQLLSVFGGDVDRNIFRIPLDDRRAELESLPWVQHATVMRLLPDRVRVGIVERTPVAFVREGRRIGLVDANGVLLDMNPEAGAEAGGGEETISGKYSFPVVTGIAQTDPLSTRAARMRIYGDFLGALDAGGEGISHKLSEVDLSDPEDVKALVPDAGSGAEVLVHFGDDKYLDRYHRYEEHLPEWRQQYPHLASVDMRYEQQVVLEMLPGTSGDAAAKGAGAADGGAVTAVKPVAGAGTKPAAKAGAVRPKAQARVRPGGAEQGHTPRKTAAIDVKGRVPVVATSAAPAHHLTTAYAVSSGGAKISGKTPAGDTGVGAAR